MLIALVREPSPSLANCELTHLDRQPIDVELARRQHHRYEQCLAALGCQILRLPAEPALPDSVFVEDTAIVLDELAVITRPGAALRRPETASVACALEPYRRLCHIQPPGTLDGGDVLCVGKQVFVGLSSRSDQAAIDQLRSALQPFGYSVKGVNVNGCLHLKSAVTQVAEDTLLINSCWVNTGEFGKLRIVQVDAAEPHGANALLIHGGVIYPTAFPHTQKRLEEQGIQVMAVDVSEFAKAEGAVTCCSLVFKRGGKSLRDA